MERKQRQVESNQNQNSGRDQSDQMQNDCKQKGGGKGERGKGAISSVIISRNMGIMLMSVIQILTEGT